MSSFLKSKLKELKELPTPAEGSSSAMSFFTDAVKKTAKIVEHGRQEVIGEDHSFVMFQSERADIMTRFNQPKPCVKSFVNGTLLLTSEQVDMTRNTKSSGMLTG